MEEIQHSGQGLKAKVDCEGFRTNFKGLPLFIEDASEDETEDPPKDKMVKLLLMTESLNQYTFEIILVDTVENILMLFNVQSWFDLFEVRPYSGV